MGWGEGAGSSIAIAAGLLLAGCTQTSRVDDNLSTASLSQSKKAVAVMRVGAASPSCINVAVLLGVREGDGLPPPPGHHGDERTLPHRAGGGRGRARPGEYHVLAYRCQSKQGIKTLADGDGGHSTAPATRASRWSSGEVVNVGYLHVGPGATAATRSAGPWRWIST